MAVVNRSKKQTEPVIKPILTVSLWLAAYARPCSAAKSWR